LTNTHILIVTERLLPPPHHNLLHGDSCERRELTKRDILKYNRLQAVQSARYVYCADDEFDIVRRLCEADPSLRDSKPSTVSIHTGPETVEGDEIRQTITTVSGTRDHPPR
jgi:hypothetical protein